MPSINFFERIKGEQQRKTDERDEFYAVIMDIATTLGIPREDMKEAEEISNDEKKPEEESIA